ncbi:hypothetical protein BDY21DRAFT_395271 [Lineolata rhizophorae]|uniref:Glyoxalase-like domain-containing protein n=1 Tax=Lineolata rhizophorae TaxID=578093 RepID=A0A6A6NWJ0_9PEZI|nr:hypothetical protein BDY21DRAFT_395271 [Lineolata rhizophorae]
MPPVRLRQIAFITHDLEKERHKLTEVFSTEVIYADPAVAQWGLKNFLVSLGGDFLEVCAPVQPDTSVGRLLDKRGDGGYMIIMQTEDAAARRAFIETNGLAKVIHSHSSDDADCVQYHPKGIKGGIMPELDTQHPSPDHPSPLTTRLSHWHACGPSSRYAAYLPAMQLTSHLALSRLALRLAPGNADVVGAAAQWSELFGIARGDAAGELAFADGVKVEFLAGEEGKREGLEEVRVDVRGRDKLMEMLGRASRLGLCGDGWIRMVGVRWVFLLVGSDGKRSYL